MGVGEHDDDADGGDDPFRDPLPPDDRLWRHPSELEAAAAQPAPPPGTRRLRVGRLLSALFPRHR
ncbi:MAG TPA: hypothetical protein VM262_17240 [Acidimicrobiales bacterium]|nr:hypothetical protein [Acidimicrobiales bacterium]